MKRIPTAVTRQELAFYMAFLLESTGQQERRKGGKEERFFFFLNPYLQNVKFNYNDYNSSSVQYVVIGISPGFTFFPAKRIGIDFTFINLELARLIKNNSRTGSFSFEGNSAYPSLSITFLLGKKELD